MRNNYYLNACVGLRHPGQGDKTCEVGIEVGADCNIDLKQLFSEVLICCSKQLGPEPLNLVSIKLGRGQPVSVVANVLLAKDKSAEDNDIDIAGEKSDVGYRKIKVEPDRDFMKKGIGPGIEQLLAHMEAESKRQLGRKFGELSHVRVIPFERDDIPADKF